MPNLVILAGPNGAGKSTSADDLLQGALSVHEFVNADAIARGLSEFNPEGVAIEAGRVMLERLKHLARERRNFAFETTLSSRTFAPWIRQLKIEGYRFVLVFLYLPRPETSVERVATRVSFGGHYVPPEVVHRRYEGGLRNFFDLYAPIADQWLFYDNSVRPRELIADGEGIQVTKTPKPDLWHTISGVYEHGIFRGPASAPGCSD